MDGIFFGNPLYTNDYRYVNYHSSEQVAQLKNGLIHANFIDYAIWTMPTILRLVGWGTILWLHYEP